MLQVRSSTLIVYHIVNILLSALSGARESDSPAGFCVSTAAACRSRTENGGAIRFAVWVVGPCTYAQQRYQQRCAMRC